MEKKLPYEFQTNQLKIDKQNQFNINKIFSSHSADICPIKLFTIMYNSIPNVLSEYDINVEKAVDWFINVYQMDIKDSIYNKKNNSEDNLSIYDDIYFFLFDDLIIHFDTNCKTVELIFRETEYGKVEKVASGIRAFKEQDKNSKIFLLIRDSNGISLQGIKLQKNSIDISLNYNDDFISVHEQISNRLSKENDKGIVLLHGVPGTGKTSYIRHLISTTKKTIIFVPHTMAQALTSPDLMGLLLDNKNSILVIEDAENIIVDRNRHGDSPVSAILNLSDGLLSDCLNLQVICTFNSDYTKIDSALTRKGRLIARYDFKKLDTHKANKLAKLRGKDITFTEPTALTDIYNLEESSFENSNTKSTIGFRAIA